MGSTSVKQPVSQNYVGQNALPLSYIAQVRIVMSKQNLISDSCSCFSLLLGVQVTSNGVDVGKFESSAITQSGFTAFSLNGDAVETLTLTTSGLGADEWISILEVSEAQNVDPGINAASKLNPYVLHSLTFYREHARTPLFKGCLFPGDIFTRV